MRSLFSVFLLALCSVIELSDARYNNYDPSTTPDTWKSNDTSTQIPYWSWMRPYYQITTPYWQNQAKIPNLSRRRPYYQTPNPYWYWRRPYTQTPTQNPYWSWMRPYYQTPSPYWRNQAKIPNLSRRRPYYQTPTQDTYWSWRRPHTQTHRPAAQDPYWSWRRPYTQTPTQNPYWSWMRPYYQTPSQTPNWFWERPNTLAPTQNPYWSRRRPYYQTPIVSKPKIRVYQQVENTENVMVMCKIETDWLFKLSFLQLSVKGDSNFILKNPTWITQNMCVFNVTVSPPVSFTCVHKFGNYGEDQFSETYMYSQPVLDCHKEGISSSYIGFSSFIVVGLIIMTATVIVATMRSNAKGSSLPVNNDYIDV
ncbi:uncharacterized protein LOC127423781 isoform X2 [Myxocyprinus asiaticus]|uniref:uncharacterized protein LOC127423781 isoform X2 n=1 Tax=Myxocyprinus asiaticus TaxID=70543 RepID=UPI0022222CAD|nr:uncharacterized protein LOC127423781 isoform X2 [Myxocyprinus asiaticus]